jgi:hypothetical protein
MKSIFILIILFGYFFAEADGNRVGNGGNIIICKEGNSERLTLLDLYESNLELEVSVKGANEFEIAAHAFKNFAKFDHKISEQYLKALNHFPKEMELKEKINITSSQDTKHIEIPTGCYLKQIAVRKNQPSIIEKRFMIARDYWQRLNSVDRAGLVVHEIIYDHLYKLGEEDSVKARKLTAYMLSKNIKQDTPEKVREFVNSLKVPLYRSAK